MATTMKAAVVAQRGKASFEIKELDVPSPGPGQILVRVESAGVNFSDVKRRRGDAYPFATEFPFIPGGEVAGTVEALGEGVESPTIGTRVFALAGPNGFGGYAQFAVASAQTVHPIPPGISTDDACVLTIAGGTAKVMLKLTAELKTGESIFIPAATGGVGSFAIQIAKQMGAGLIVAGVGGDAKLAEALSLGAHHAVNMLNPSWPGEVRALAQHGIDVVLESAGGGVLEQTLDIAAPFARIIVYGSGSGEPATLSPSALTRLFYDPVPNQILTGFNIGAWFWMRPQQAGPALGELIGDVLQGKIALPRITALPLAKAQSAHEALESRQVVGKLVLKPWL